MFRYCADENIMIKGRETKAGSKILEGFVSPFSATVIERAGACGGELICQSKTDEFGLMPLFSEAPEPEGVGLVRSGGCDAVLSNDFCGKMRKYMPRAGGYYIHPTYGSVSRYGLVAAVSSQDACGVGAAGIDRAMEVLGSISGHDDRDGTSLPEESLRRPIQPDAGKMRIAVPENLVPTEGAAAAEYAAAVEKLKSAGASVNRVTLPYAEYIPQVWYITASAEISNNLTRYDGIKFGYRAQGYRGVNDLYLKTRTEGFGTDVKLCAVMGSMVLSKEHYGEYYDKAMRVRRLIRGSVCETLESSDAVLLPTTTGKTPYGDMALYAMATLCGLPSLSLPNGGLGLQLVGGALCENRLYGIGKEWALR